MSAMPEMTICSPYHGGHLLFWYLANTEPVRMSDPIKGYEYYMDRMSILSDVGCQQVFRAVGSVGSCCVLCFMSHQSKVVVCQSPVFTKKWWQHVESEVARAKLMFFWWCWQ